MHSWNLSPAEAIQLQKTLSSQIIRQDDFETIKTLAGADLALCESKREALAGVILYEYPSLRELQRISAKGPLDFPYVPGLLSFREGPVLLKAFEKIKPLPDLIIFDGQGIAHPRRLGIASHMGLWLNRPTIGCAKSLLCGKYQEVGKKRGDWSLLIDQGEEIGAVLRTRDQVKPVFISIGHKISLKTALQIILNCPSGFRIPKPTREADHFVACLKKI